LCAGIPFVVGLSALVWATLPQETPSASRPGVESVLVRFRFASDALISAPLFEGVYVDDVKIYR
jgi:hypothetical protein